MDKQEIQEYLSALADKDISGLSSDEIDELEGLLEKYPEYFSEYQLDIITKICLLKHNQPLKCPPDTQRQIKTSIVRMLNTLRDSR